LCCEPGLTLTRRTFVKTSALVGGVAALATQCRRSPRRSTNRRKWWTGAAVAAGANGYRADADPNNILYSSCLQCNTGCPIKVKIVDGVISKIDGNPFAPSTFWPYLDYTTPPMETRRHRRLDLPEGTGWAAKHL
jgi:tetrathionate reductase subunit A